MNQTQGSHDTGQKGLSGPRPVGLSRSCRIQPISANHRTGCRQVDRVHHQYRLRDNSTSVLDGFV